MTTARLLSARAIAAEIGELLRCATCRKLTTVANTAGHRQSFEGEKVTLRSHCACPGGPAEKLVPEADPAAPLCSFCNTRPAIYMGACQVCC